MLKALGVAPSPKKRLNFTARFAARAIDIDVN
jgi:hypothetical protein